MPTITSPLCKMLFSSADYKGPFTLRANAGVSATLRTHKPNSLKTATAFTLSPVRFELCVNGP